MLFVPVGAEDGLGLVRIGELRRFAAPDHGQSFARQDQVRPDDDPGKELGRKRGGLHAGRPFAAGAATHSVRGRCGHER